MNPVSGLTFDANDDLLVTTFGGGAFGDGTVFGILNTGSGYASIPTALVSFNGADGANPVGSLIIDANGNLFGTTDKGGANNDGSDLFGTTILGGASNDGTVFQINGAGFFV